MKALVLLSICFLLFSCNNQKIDCNTPNLYAPYTVSGKVTKGGYNRPYVRATIDWMADSTSIITLNYNECSTIYEFKLSSLVLDDTLWLRDSLALPIAEIWSADDDAVTPPFVNSYCNDCFVWFGSQTNQNFQLNSRLAMIPLGMPMPDTTMVETELMLIKK
jgi:hypothetical protein